MKKLISAVILSLCFGAVINFAQTKKHPVKRRVRTPVKRTTVKKSMNNINSSAVTTESGLTYIITEHGAGAQLKDGDTVSINYTGLLTSGQKFDSSLDRGEPFAFTLGAGMVIKGWDEGVAKLHIGDKAILTIPSTLGYGKRGAGGVIPPDATLIFIVEVVGVK